MLINVLVELVPEVVESRFRSLHGHGYRLIARLVYWILQRVQAVVDGMTKATRVLVVFRVEQLRELLADLMPV